jgi:polar amino acid transport system substrate-binding protein
VVFSNVTVTEKRKQLFDFATYRNDVLGFYAKADSGITSITGASDVAGKRIIVGSGTNQEKILLAWDADNTAAGLPAVAFQYYDDEAAASLAIQSGRADLTFGPNATGAYQAASTGRTKLVGTVSGGFPLKAEIAATTAKDNGLVAALQLALQEAFDNGSYAEVLKRWNLTAEAIDAPQTNPAGLPDT